MKVMIAYPPLKGLGSPMLTQNRQFQWYNEPSYIYPVVSAYAATLLKNDGHDVIWKDCIAEREDETKFIEDLLKETPQIIMFETKTPVVKQHWQWIKRVKELLPQTITVLVGDHVTALPEESMLNSSTDFLITGGNYDISLKGIVDFLNGKGDLPKGVWYRENGVIKNSGEFELNFNLNNLPFIDRVLTKAKNYGEKWKKKTPFFYTMAGRDCPWFKCTFCAWTTLYNRFRTRTPENLLDEIGFLIENHNAKEIFDDTGTFPGGGWLKKFCEGMIERGYNKEILFSCNMRFDYINPEIVELMKKAGFRKIKAGLESANQVTLDKIEKGITVSQIVQGCKIASKAGIDIQLTVMVGYPWETKEDAQRTVDLAKELMAKGYAEMLQATVLIPYPGTKLYEFALKENLFLFDPKEYERFDMREPVLKTVDMSADEVMKMCNRIYQSFLTPAFIIRNILKIRKFDDVKYILKGAKAVVGHLKDFYEKRKI